jgi:hypothetical protein
LREGLPSGRERYLYQFWCAPTKLSSDASPRLIAARYWGRCDNPRPQDTKNIPDLASGVTEGAQALRTWPGEHALAIEELDGFCRYSRKNPWRLRLIQTRSAQSPPSRAQCLAMPSQLDGTSARICGNLTARITTHSGPSSPANQRLAILSYRGFNRAARALLGRFRRHRALFADRP